MINQKEVRDYVADEKPFKGSNLRGFFEGAGAYVIRSYDTDIVCITGNRIVVNRTKYSPSTSRQMSAVMAGIDRLMDSGRFTMEEVKDCPFGFRFN